MPIILISKNMELEILEVAVGNQLGKLLEELQLEL